MVLIKTNQTLLILEIDRSRVIEKKSPLGINGLMNILYIVFILIILDTITSDKLGYLAT